MDNPSVPSQDAFSLTKGAVFHDQYEVVRRIDSGAMGTVYEVLDRRTKRRRALKVMLARFVDNPEVIERFRREATVTADVVSEHVVETFDAGVDRDTGLPFLVMELLRGEDLGKVVARGPMPAAEVVTLLIQASSAIDRMHAAGVVHRDLKPENLFITRRDDGAPRLKVLDFGIAKVVEKAGPSATSTRNMGTPVYMSPEQVMGAGDVGPPADLYAVGHLAYTMLTGQPYWLEDALAFETVYPLLLKIMNGATEPASERALRNKQVRLPEGFDAWFAKATAHAAEDRFRSSTASILALATALDVARPMLASWPLDQVLGLAPTIAPHPPEAGAATDLVELGLHDESGAPPIPLVPRAAAVPRGADPIEDASLAAPSQDAAAGAAPDRGGALDAPPLAGSPALEADRALASPSPDAASARKEEALRTLSPVSTLPHSRAVTSRETSRPPHTRRLVAFGAAFFLAGVIGAVLLVRGVRRAAVADGALASPVAPSSAPLVRTASAQNAQDPAVSSSSMAVSAQTSGSTPLPSSVIDAPSPSTSAAPSPTISASASVRPLATRPPSTRRPPSSSSASPSSKPARPYGDPSRDL